jgi:ribosome-associated protein
MTKGHIIKEVDEIFDLEKYPYPLNAAMASALIIGNFKGFDLKIIDVEDKTSLADFFILGSTDNQTQSRAIAEEIEYQLKRKGFPAKSVEGKQNADWILLDHGDILVHIFSKDAREIYNLEELWKESKSVKIPQSFYFSPPDDELSKKSKIDKKDGGKDEGKNYF